MASNTKSASTIVEWDNIAANAGFSIAKTGSSATAATAPTTNMMTLTQAQYDVLQAQIVAAQLTTRPTMSFALSPAPTAFGYYGKRPKPNKYYGRFCGKYNTFIKQCESNFILEGNNFNAGRVAYGVAFLASTSSKV